MNNHLALFFCCILVIEFIKITNLVKIINKNLRIYKKFLNLLKYGYSETLKERLYFLYSKHLLSLSIKIIIILLIIILFLILMDKFSPFFLKFLFTYIGLIETLILFFIYGKIRKVFE